MSDDTRSPRDSEGPLAGPRPQKPSNRREFELALRRMLGFSKREAKFIAACGYAGLEASVADDASDKLLQLLQQIQQLDDRKDAT